MSLGPKSMFNYFFLNYMMRVVVVLCLKSQFGFFVVRLEEGKRDK